MLKIVLWKDGDNKITKNAETEQGPFTTPMDQGKTISRDRV